VFSLLEAYWNLLDTRLVLFGEWLYAQHGVAYDALPGYFLAFDIFDKQTDEWWSTRRVRETLQAAAIPVVPLVREWRYGEGETTTAASIMTDVRAALKRRSTYSQDEQEGLYIRFENADKVLYRCKLRRPTFTAGREDFDSHLVTNGLRM